MPKKSKNEFDFGGYLQSEGLQFKRLNDQGQPVVLDTQSNQEGVFDVDGLLGSLGTTRNDTNISYNTMDNPVNISPLTVADRAKVKGLGNERGSVKFLRNKFEQVFPHEEKGLLVKNAGVWHQVDPTGLGGGNPWEMAKELTKDIADLSDIGLNALIAGKGAVVGAAKGAAAGAAAGSIVPGLGTAAGAAIGGVAGGVAGAGIGGAAAGGVRTSLGRFFGTYDTTPDEEIKDIAIEGLYTMAGQGIAAGARPTLQGLVKAGTKLSRAPIKEGVIALYGRLTGVGDGAMRELLENGPQVGTALKSAVKEAGRSVTGEAAANVAKDRAIGFADELFDAANDGLNRKYGQLLDNVLTSAEKKNLKVNMKSVVDKSMSKIEDAGLGKIEVVKNKPILQALTESERITRIQQGLDAPVVDKVTMRDLNTIIRELDGFGQGGVLKGRLAANRLTAVNRRLNALTKKGFTEAKTQDYKTAVAEATSGFRNSVQTEFENVGMGKQYAEMQGLYSKFANSVASARKLKKSAGGGETFVNRLSSDSGANRTQVGIAKDLVEIAGKKGQDAFNNMRTFNAASKFAPLVPKLGLLQLGVIGSGFTGLLTPSLGTVAGLTQFSPRAVAFQVNQMQKMGQGLNWLKTLAPAQREAFITNPAAFQTWAGSIAQSVERENRLGDQLLQGSGALDQ